MARTPRREGSRLYIVLASRFGPIIALDKKQTPRTRLTSQRHQAAGRNFSSYEKNRTAPAGLPAAGVAHRGPSTGESRTGGFGCDGGDCGVFETYCLP